MKIAFSFFLYSQCGAPASWPARHTTVCLDVVPVFICNNWIMVFQCLSAL